MKRVLDLLNQAAGSTTTTLISRSAYDTAWLARMDNDLGRKSHRWLLDHQLPDGSWGTAQVVYHHERMICTLAATLALVEAGEPASSVRIRRARHAIGRACAGLETDPAGATIGFELIVPVLLRQAAEYGIGCGDAALLDRLLAFRQAKLAALPAGVIDRHTTVSFSAEMVDGNHHLLNVDELQSENGSISYSPAATAFFAAAVRPGDPAAMGYLRRMADADGAVPYVGPIEVFDQAWTLWNLALTGNMDAELAAACRPLLDRLAAQWQPGRGISSAVGLELLDGDDTAVAAAALARFGRAPDLDAILRYEKPYHFTCYPLEADPSVSANIHVLDALRQAGLPATHPTVQKIIRFLRATARHGMFWLDKWHASPYYPTAHAIIAAAGYVDRLVSDAIRWILQTQGADGSWGYYLPTAEETAYCLQALVTWQRAGHGVPQEILHRGAAWLAAHTAPPYPPLWIGKCLYCPQIPVQSAVLSALRMAE